MTAPSWHGSIRILSFLNSQSLEHFQFCHIKHQRLSFQGIDLSFIHRIQNLRNDPRFRTIPRMYHFQWNTSHWILQWIFFGSWHGTTAVMTCSFRTSDVICGIKARTHCWWIKTQHLTLWIWQRDVTRPLASWHPYAISTSWDIAFLFLNHEVLLYFMKLIGVVISTNWSTGQFRTSQCSLCWIWLHELW